MSRTSSSVSRLSCVVALALVASLTGCSRYYAGHAYVYAPASPPLDPTNQAYASSAYGTSAYGASAYGAPIVSGSVYVAEPSVSASLVVQPTLAVFPEPQRVVVREAETQVVSSSSCGASAGGESPTEAAAAACTAPLPEVTDCRVRCTVDFDRHRTDCRGPITLDHTAQDYRTSRQALFRVDMAGYTELAVEIEACEPSGWVLHVGDSRSNDGWGGDMADFSNDAELHVNGAAGLLSSQLYASDEAGGRLVRPADRREVTLGDRCERHRYGFADQRVSYDDGTAVCDPALLRVQPPGDREGRPDSTWWVGVNRTIRGGDRVGTGVTQAVLCLR